MTTSHDVSVNIKSTLTTDILLKSEDGSYFPNIYDEMAKFIAQAFITDDISKTIRCLRFETKPFIKDKCEDIHKEWLDFDRKVSDYCSSHQSQFRSSGSFIPIVEI